MKPIRKVNPISWETCYDELHNRFSNEAHGQCFVWINPAQSDPFNDDDFAISRRVQMPITHPRFDRNSGPYLIHLDLASSADEDIFRVSVEKAWDAWTIENLEAMQGQPICGWIAASVGPEDIAHHWARRCHLHKRGKLTRFLRFHDPGVREWLWPCLTKNQRSALIGPANSIHSSQLQNDFSEPTCITKARCCIAFS